MGQGRWFKGRQFTSEVILRAVRWYLMFPISYRDLELMLLDRGVEVNHTTVFRWIQAYAAELEKRIPSAPAGEQRMLADERDIRSGQGTLDLSLSGGGQPGADDRLSALGEAVCGGGEVVLPQGPGAADTVNPRTITVDKNPAYPRAAAEMKKQSELWRRSRLRQYKYLNNIVEQDHRRIKRLVRPGLGFGSFRTARRTLAGFEAMAMIRKGQVRNIGGRDIRGQATFVACSRWPRNVT